MFFSRKTYPFQQVPQYAGRDPGYRSDKQGNQIKHCHASNSRRSFPCSPLFPVQDCPIEAVQFQGLAAFPRFRDHLNLGSGRLKFLTISATSRGLYCKWTVARITEDVHRSIYFESIETETHMCMNLRYKRGPVFRQKSPRRAQRCNSSHLSQLLLLSQLLSLDKPE